MELSSPGERLRQLIQNYVNADDDEPTNLSAEELEESIVAVTPDNRYAILSSQSEFDDERTILHAAAYREDCDIVSCVLDNVSADERVKLLNIQDGYGHTPLHAALWGNEDKSTLEAMMDRVPTEYRLELLKIMDTNGWSVMHVLALHSDLIVKYFSNIPCSEQIDLLKTQDNFGKTPLHDKGILYDRVIYGEFINNKFKLLLENLPAESRVDLLKIRDEFGNTPLHYQADAIEEVVANLQKLISTDNLLDLLLIPDNEGRTVIHKAIKYPSMEFVDWLSRYFTEEQIVALLTAKDKQGRQPLSYAIERANITHGWCKEKTSCDAMKATSSILRLLPSSEKVKQLQSHVDEVSRLLRTECSVVNPVNTLIECLTSEELHQILSMDKYRESVNVHLLTLENISRVMNSLTADQRYELASKKNKEGNTSLHLVTADKAVQILQLLLPTQTHQLLNITNNEGKTAIDVKVERRDQEINALRQFTSSVSLQQTAASYSHAPLDMTTSIDYDSSFGNSSVVVTQLSAPPNQTNQLVSTVQGHQQMSVHIGHHNIHLPPEPNSRTSVADVLQSTNRMQPQHHAVQVNTETNEQQIPLQSNVQPFVNWNPVASSSTATQENGNILHSLPTNSFHQTPAMQSNHLVASTPVSSLQIPTHPAHQPQVSMEMLPARSSTSATPSHLPPDNLPNLPELRGEADGGGLRAGCKRSAPSDWSTPTSSQLTGHLFGGKLQFRYREQGHIVSFKSENTVEDLVNQVKAASGSDCVITDTDESKYGLSVTLDLVTPPFVMKIGESRAVISERGHAADNVPGPSTSTSSPNTPDRLPVFGRVGNVQEVVDLLTFVHEQMKAGKTVNGALKLAKKNRKTIDRFLNIYYLHSQNRERLLELEREWLSNGQDGGLQRLDELAKEEINWEQLKIMFYEGSVGDFTLRKDK